MKTPKITIFFLIFIAFLNAQLNGQTKNKDVSKFYLSFQTGFSFLSPTNPGQNIFSMVYSNISLGKSELMFGYQYLNHHRVLLSFGKDNFNKEYDVYSGPPEKPIYVQTSIRKIENYWLGFYYEYHFNRKKVTPHLGIGTGLNEDNNVLFIYSGVNIDYLEPISFIVKLRYSRLFTTTNTSWFAKSVGSQIGIDFGVNYEF